MNKTFLRFIFHFLPCLLIAFLNLSCSNANQVAEAFEDSDTLRYTAEKLYSTTNWTEEIETDRLTTSVSSVKGVSSKLNLSPLIVAAKVPDENSAIFPKLANFGSLDTTLISPSLRTTLNSFCEAISNNNDSAAEGFLKKENLYSLGLFYVDFRRIFNESLGIEKYEKELEEWQNQQKEKQSDNKSDKDNKTEDTDGNSEKSDVAELPEEKKPEIVFFDDYVFGEPFLDGIYYEVPVLFTGKKANLTLSLFCFEESGAWKIDQIQISDWEIF